MSGMFSEVQVSSKKKSVEWYTPEWIFQELKLQFDLDPCSPHDMESFVPAANKYTIYDNGLLKPWFGQVWLNPPYGRDTGTWMDRMIAHGQGLALLFSRTDAKWCQSAMKASDAVLFMSGRIAFVPGLENQHKKSRAGAGTVIFAFGEESAEALGRLSSFGVLYGN